jgi:ATP/maltotriose-dependent transcriptional regulator MalT
VTRLADVVKPVGQAIFTPIVRPRIVQRIELAAAGCIILIVAPAGYGKSLALSHWLARQPRKHQRFDVQPEHNTLLGFARGLAEAFAPSLPALRKTVSTASQNSAASAVPGNEMARWMAAHLEAFDGIVVIDDFHRASDDIEISRFVASLIARTKTRIRWVLATRSTLDLPVASWLAYGDAHFVIGDRDLTFREDEVRELAESGGGPLADPALRGIMDATSGWPVALSLALRNSAIIQGANLANSTREVLFQYLAEQVYDQLFLDEREILQCASYLPSVEVAVLEAVGYPDCARVLEAVRRRATFLSLESPGSYKCHDLFREFLKRQIEISDPPRAREIQAVAAAALESVGNTVAALHLYSGLRATNEVLRILRLHGFDLIDHSHGDAVERAFRALPNEVRTTDAVILGLRAQREADAGHLDRAEALFRRAIRDPALAKATTATLSIRLAIILLNRGKPAAGVLEPLLPDASTAVRAEVYGLLSADYSSKGSPVEAEAAISNAETLSSSVEDDAVTAKTSLRVAIAGLNVGLPLSRVRRAATAASELADRAELPILAGRALTVLAAVSLCLENDIGKLVHYAALARTRAAQSGDVASLVTALLQLACAETQRGDEAKLKELLEELSDVPDRPDSCEGIIQLLRATLFAWNGDVKNAEHSMDRFSRYGYSYYDFDRIADIALHSMYCAALGLRAKALSLVTEATRQIKVVNVPHEYAKSQRALATTICGTAHMLSHRTSVGRQILKNVLDISESPPAQIMSSAILSLREVPDRNEWKSTVAAHLEPLEIYQLGGLKKTVESCIERYAATAMLEEASEAALTRAELQVLRAVADGQSTKEIAALSDRSVHTVRTLIQRATSKLGCTSRYDAVRILQGTSGRE